ncbi:MAG TPA: sugar-transfer associated ATP-grasp domain-containing protein, partial [Planctomycetota bacterium]|nr:sugar-transfer associated ATP-grasp domain-containing protein [Planctomycetota bacterium]
PVLGVLDAGGFTPEEAASLDAPECAGDLYLKPDGGGQGVGIALWPAGDPRGLLERSRRAPPPAPLLVQPRIRGHPDLAPVSNGHVCSLRITTYLGPGGGVEHVLPALKMAAGEAFVDNFSRGNLAAPVDPATGRLGRPWSYDARKVPAPREAHPDTGAPIAGREVPLFREAVDLCRRAHASFEGLFACGWDVAATAGGPVLIEGNRIFGVILPQLVWDTPLGETAYPAALRAALEGRAGRIGAPGA